MSFDEKEIEAVTKVLKDRFNNLSVTELLHLTFKILEAVHLVIDSEIRVDNSMDRLHGSGD